MPAASPLYRSVQALKGAAEPTRLRLLALLRHGELTVGEICKVLGQSQPRVSRHLRLLAEAGFLDRFRELQCVYYRVPVAGAGLDWLRPLLAQLELAEPLMRRDHERMNQVIAARGQAALRQWPEARTAAATPPGLVAALNEEIGAANLGALLDIGTGSGRMLEAVAHSARHAVGLDISALALRLARARLHGADGFHHCEFHRGDMYALPCEDASFDTVTMDRVLASAERPAEVLREAARALRADGRLIVVEDYGLFGAGVDEDPMRRLSGWFGAAGLAAETLRPCRLPDGHFLIATARRAAAAGERRVQA